MRELAPVAVFIYKRAAHTRAMLRSLKLCEGFSQSPIFLFADGPKALSEVPAIEEARRVAVEELGDRAQYSFRERNAGLAASIIEGVSALTGSHDRVIVIEDDLELSPAFLAFMNAALDRYADVPQVMQVSGHQFSVPEFSDRTLALLLPFTTTWGWGTWRRAWDLFDSKAGGWELLQTDTTLRRRFNLNDTYDYATMMERRASGDVDSWGILWYWSVFKNRGSVCFPPQTLVRNAGMDGSGTHGRGTIRKFGKAGSALADWVPALPDYPADHALETDAVIRSIWRQNGGYLGSVVDHLRRRARAIVRHTRTS